MHNDNLDQAICVYLESSLIRLLARISPKEPRSCIALEVITVLHDDHPALTFPVVTGQGTKTVTKLFNREKQQDRSDEEVQARRRGPAATPLGTVFATRLPIPAKRS